MIFMSTTICQIQNESPRSSLSFFVNGMLVPTFFTKLNSKTTINIPFATTSEPIQPTSTSCPENYSIFNWVKYISMVVGLRMQRLLILTHVRAWKTVSVDIIFDGVVCCLLSFDFIFCYFFFFFFFFMVRFFSSSVVVLPISPNATLSVRNAPSGLSHVPDHHTTICCFFCTLLFFFFFFFVEPVRVSGLSQKPVKWCLFARSFRVVCFVCGSGLVSGHRCAASTYGTGSLVSVCVYDYGCFFFVDVRVVVANALAAGGGRQQQTT